MIHALIAGITWSDIGLVLWLFGMGFIVGSRFEARIWRQRVAELDAQWRRSFGLLKSLTRENEQATETDP
jgi:hypothetical protein